MGKHYTKAELLEHVKHAKKMSRDANRVGFYVISVLGCYCMWKHEGWGQERLQRYLQQVYTYWYGEEELDKWNERLEKVAGFPVTVTYLSEEHNRYKKTKVYRHAMESILQEAENAMMDVYRKYALIHFNVLMDNGWGEIRLNRNREYLDECLRRYQTDENGTARHMAKELYERVGVIFDEP